MQHVDLCHIFTFVLGMVKLGLKEFLGNKPQLLFMV